MAVVNKTRSSSASGVLINVYHLYGASFDQNARGDNTPTLRDMLTYGLPGDILLMHEGSVTWPLGEMIAPHILWCHELALVQSARDAGAGRALERCDTDSTHILVNADDDSHETNIRKCRAVKWNDFLTFAAAVRRAAVTYTRAQTHITADDDAGTAR